jgi:hypothetical protein
MAHSSIPTLLIDPQCLQFIPSMSRQQDNDSPRLDRRTETTSRHARKRLNPVFKEIIMNAKTLIAALSLAIVGNAALAAEGEQFNPAASAVSRAEAQASVATPAVKVTSYGEATVFADAPAAAAKSREEVRAAARDLSFNELYAG